MLTVTLLSLTPAVPAPVSYATEDMPTRYFTVSGQIWGKSANGDIVDVYGTPASAAEAPHLRIRIDSFLIALA